MKQMMHVVRLLLIIIGTLGFFANERYFSQYELYGALKILFLGFVVAAVLISVRMSMIAKKAGLLSESKCWVLSSIWKSSLLLGLLTYLLYSQLLGDDPNPQSLVHKGLLVAYLLLMLLGGLSGIGIEKAIWSHGLGPRSDFKGIYLGMKSSIGIALLVSSFALVNYAANKLDRAFDWSYLKTAEPGESTKRIASGLSEPIKIGAFFSRDSEVEPFVREYLEKIARDSENIELQFYSRDFNPSKAELFRVARDGQVVLMKGDQRQRIDVGEKLAFARRKLRKFDQLFQKSILALSSAKKNIYVSKGHGEMTWKGNPSASRKLKNFEKVLRSLNFNIRELDLMQDGVPQDASLLVVPGPSQSFTQQDIGILKEYLDRGGSLMVFFDVEFAGSARKLETLAGGDLFEQYIESIGIRFNREFLANDKQFVRNTRKSIDHYFLFTNIFTSHESMTNISKQDEKMGILSFQSGYLSESQVLLGGWKVSTLVKSLKTSFIDINRNTKFDVGEKRSSVPIAMVSESEKSKVIVFSDSTMLSDPILVNPGNQVAVVDSVRWLVGESDYMGRLNSEEDVKIQHSKSRDLLVFHGSIFFIPMLVLIFGFFATRREKENH